MCPRRCQPIVPVGSFHSLTVFFSLTGPGAAGWLSVAASWAQAATGKQMLPIPGAEKCWNSFQMPRFLEPQCGPSPPAMGFFLKPGQEPPRLASRSLVDMRDAADVTAIRWAGVHGRGAREHGFLERNISVLREERVCEARWVAGTFF